MIDKKKFLLFNRLTMIVILIFLILFLINKSFAFFQTTGTGEAISDIAFYVVDANKQSEEVKMFEIAPDDQDYIYNISVTNTKDGKISEVDLEYELTLITTTNLPVEYAIYLDGTNENIITNKEIYQDEDGMYFYKFHIPKQNFIHDETRTDNYQLIINLSSVYSDEAYQGLIDSISIVVDSKQV